jgi:gamma-glutamyltranspeptidase/glutathione hydrolase
MKQGGGIITREDLKNYRTVERKPDTFSYRGYTVITMPLPSSGSMILRQVLSILSWYPVRNYGFASPAAIHLMAEAERRSYADRARYLGDPDFVPDPSALLNNRDI